jgi:tetratricopeptide (TPR) repeat protein
MPCPQITAPEYVPLSSPAPQSVSRSGGLSAPADGKRKLRADDPNLLLFWHDEILDASADYRNGAAPDTPAPGRENGTFPTLSPHAGQQPANESRLPDAREIQAKYAEQAMREEFALLVESMSENEPDTPLESAAAALIARDVPFFGRKQKFMFTEFGLALKRKNKCELALLCHLRALALAPGDENVLFNVAGTEYALGRPDKAAERLDKALRVNPRFTAAAHFLAFLRGNTGRAG